MNITVEKVRECFNYDPETGILRWKIKIARKVKIGQEAGNLANGYRELQMDGVRYRVHQLVWVHYYGDQPNREVDHINGIRDDNRIVNLRLATGSENCHNYPAHRDSLSGYKGVSWFRKTRKWRARIMIKGKDRTIGYFDLPKDAAIAYDQAAYAAYGEFAKLNFPLKGSIMARNVMKDGGGSSSVPETYKIKGEETVITPKTIETDRSKASGKAKMNFKYPPLMPDQEIKGNGPVKHRAMTPGTTPEGS